jgi:hypothetical protein
MTHIAEININIKLHQLIVVNNLVLFGKTVGFIWPGLEVQL